MRWLTRLATALGILLLVVALLAGAALVVSQTRWFRNQVRAAAVAQAARILNGTLAVSAVEGNLVTGTVLRDLRLIQDGREVVAADEVRVSYRAWELVRGDLVFRDLTVVRPRVRLVQDASGWPLTRLLRLPERRGPGRALRLTNIMLREGTVTFERTASDGAFRWPARVSALEVDLSLTVAGGVTDLDVARATFTAEEPGLRVASLAGRWTTSQGRHYVQNLHLRTDRSVLDGWFSYLPATDTRPTAEITSNLSVAPFDAAEFAALLPALSRRPLVLTGAVSATGPANRLRVDARLADAAAGRVRANLIVNAAGTPRTIRGSVATENLDLARPFANPQLASRLTTEAQLDLRATDGFAFDRLTGTAQVRSRSSRIWGYEWRAASSQVRFARGVLAVNGQARAYGASATARGTIAPTARPVRYQLAGRVAEVDLRQMPRQLPTPRLESDLAGTYAVTGAGTRLDATMTFMPSTVERTAIGNGSRGRFANLAGTTQYGFDGRVEHADIERWGHALDIEALQREMYASDLNGELRVEGSGTTLAELTLDATAALESSTVFGAGIERADVTGHIEQQSLRTTARGTITGANPTALAGVSTLDSGVSGAFDVAATVARLDAPVTIESVEASGSMDLQSSFVGPLDISTGRLEATVTGGEARIARFEAQGPQMDVTASGQVALNNTGQSKLDYTVSVADLSRISPLVGRTLAGRAQATGALSGTLADPTVTATVAASSVKVDTVFEALNVEATVDGRVTGRGAGDVTGSLTSTSTLATVAGRHVPELTVALDKAGNDIQFKVEAREAGRAVGGEGQVTLFPGYRDVRVNRLSIEAGPGRWTLPEAAPMLARYDDTGLLTFSNGFTLMNGSQSIAAQGTLSLAADVPGALTVRAIGLDLAGVGDLLLADRPLGGTLDTAAEIGGTADARTVAGQFAIRDGLVGDYGFQALDAKVDYSGSRAAVDGRLTQSPGSQLDLHGVIPVSLERGELTDGPLQVDVSSAGIDLAVLAAATTALEAVRGQLVVDVHLTGTGLAPRAEGIVAVEQGAFTVAATGVPYTDVSMQAHLDGNDVRIAQLRMLDDDDHLLEGTGTLHLEERAVRDIQFTVTATDFEVLDNELGELAVDSSLNVSGTVLAPKVEGLVQVRTGRLEVDALLDRFTSSAYSIEPEAAETPAAAAGAPPAASDAAVARPVEFNVTVAVPDNLVLRGRDIRTAGSSVALGNMNITAGGNFTLRRGADLEPVLLGEINTVRGTYDFQGRRFEVLRDGRILFRGTQPIDPALDVTAERVISGIVANVNITGTARSPRVTLSSQPPLEESDIFSLIVFNQPVNRLGQGEVSNLAERAAGMASGFVVTPLAVSLERALDLDLVELDAVGDERGGPSATIGRQVGEKLFVKFRQSFGTQDVSEFDLEYQISNFLRLEGSIAQGRNAANRSLTRRVERGGIDLVVFFSY